MLVAAALREARSLLALGRAVLAAAPRLLPSPAALAPPPPPPHRFGGLELAGFGAGGAPDEGDGGGAAAAAAAAASPLSWSTWLMAVPKRRHSHSRKRHRQSNPLYQEQAVAHMYPCPKCDKGLVKLRHHLCPCDQDRAGANGVVRVTYGGGPAAQQPA